jgi:hypothetical protein
MIAAERQRQITEEGWTPEHDDEHDDESLALAAACFASPRQLYVGREMGYGEVYYRDPWPLTWARSWDKRPRDAAEGKLRPQTKDERLRLLAKAGALIAAEIDRLLRASDEEHVHLDSSERD